MGVLGENWFSAAGEFTIANSCRFNHSDTAFTERDLASTGNRKTYSYSVWVKRSIVKSTGAPSYETIIAASDETNTDGMTWNDDYLYVVSAGSGTTLRTNAVYRDVSAWYHIVVGVDTTQGTEANRAKLYVNGTQVTSFSTEQYPDQNDDSLFNYSGSLHTVGYEGRNQYPISSYMAEFHLIDGTQLTPSSFGETNDEGVWVPKQYDGTYGTNGFYLKFADSSDYGTDSSGNGNDMTDSGLAANDQFEDTPTSNRMTWNPLHNMRDDGDVKDGMRIFDNTSSTRNLCGTTFHFTSELVCQAFSVSAITSSDWQIGMMASNEADVNDAAGSNEDIDGGAAVYSDGSTYFVRFPSSTADTSLAVSTSDHIWIAYNATTGKSWSGVYDASASAMVWFAADGGTDGDPANGTNEVYAGTAGTSLCFAASCRDGVDITLLEEGDANGTVPSGFTYVSDLANTLPEPTIKDPSEYFQSVVYTGNGTAIGSGGKAVTFGGNSDLEPDLVWIKNRSAVDDHAMYDSVRGTTKQIEPNTSGAGTTETEGLTTFGSDGFTVGNLAQVNTNTENYVSWGWVEGTTPDLDILTFTGNETARTISHNLGVVPQVIWTRPSGAGNSWHIYNEVLGNTKFLKFNENGGAGSGEIFWNNTSPTSSVYSVGTDGGVNSNGAEMVAYLFRGIDGFSKFDSYTGNGNVAGPFVYCGFKPQLILIKHTSQNENWGMYDASINTFNTGTVTGMTILSVNTTAAESQLTNANLDILSNGFKITSTEDTLNDDGDVYIFQAWAKNPFGGSGVSPVTAG